jgi:UDP-N-acetylglucosamine transferase subunit ALG13
MIFLSVGTQLPFDRLIRAVDNWAAETGNKDVIAQIGPSDFKPRCIECVQFLSPEEFRSLQGKARVMIAHAGMGSIVTALEFGKPIVIMPRDHSKGEHRNNHQMATAQRFLETPGVYVAMDEIELSAKLNDLGSLEAASSMSSKAPEAFTGKLKDYIASVQPARRHWMSFGSR